MYHVEMVQNKMASAMRTGTVLLNEYAGYNKDWLPHIPLRALKMVAVVMGPDNHAIKYGMALKRIAIIKVDKGCFLAKVIQKSLKFV